MGSNCDKRDAHVMWRAVVNGHGHLGEIARRVTAPQREVIEEWFEHDLVRGPLTTNLPVMRWDAGLSG